MADNLLPPGVADCIRAWKFGAASQRLRNAMDAGEYPEVGDNPQADAQYCLVDALGQLAGNVGKSLEGILDVVIDAAAQSLLDGYDYVGPQEVDINRRG
jgi:hypothetical protein